MLCAKKNIQDHVREDVDMLTSILRFFLPLIVLGGAVAGGWWLIGAMKAADARDLAAMRPAKVDADAAAAAELKASTQPAKPYPWSANYTEADSIAKRIPVPPGYERVQLDPDSFSNYLRNLPLKADGSQVKLYNGQARTDVTPAGVVDIDVGSKDLQQAAGALMRLHAEYLYYQRRMGSIRFGLASGPTVDFTQWAQGVRPVLAGGELNWTHPGRGAKADSSYASFRSFMDAVFADTNTSSFMKDLGDGPQLKNLLPGHLFVNEGRGGQGAYAAIVVDVAVDKRGARCFLLARADSPAQDIQIVRNTRGKDARILPWFDTHLGEGVDLGKGVRLSAKDVRKFR